jgi:hypothetical protein
MADSLELPADVFKGDDGRWHRECAQCGRDVDHLRRNYAVHSSLSRQPCKKCSNKNNHPSGMFGPVRVSWYESFRKSALSRGLSWDLTIEDVATLHEQQKGRCALTGMEIGWIESGWDHTASIDRIDNGFGYEMFNVQLVHKEVNMMRGSLDVDRFKELCVMVANREKW